MPYQADDFSGFGPIGGTTEEDTAQVTANLLRAALGFIEAEGRHPTAREALDALSAISALRNGEPTAARMFSRRVSAFAERRAAPRSNDPPPYTVAQIRAQLEVALAFATERERSAAARNGTPPAR